jgi:hypothetical protein
MSNASNWLTSNIDKTILTTRFVAYYRLPVYHHLKLVAIGVVLRFEKVPGALIGGQ